ncbi:hypothetical protein AAG663_07470 [Bacillus licheniformis]
MKKTKFNLICICLLSGAAALCVSILKMNEIDASLHELNEDEYGNLITISKWIGITIAVIGEAIKPLLELLFFTLIIWLAIMIFGAKDSFKNIFFKRCSFLLFQSCRQCLSYCLLSIWLKRC